MNQALYTFDDRNIHWNTLGDLQHLVYYILDIDTQRHIVDVLFKLTANQQIVLHRHIAHNNTFVIQGEHRLYEPDGTLKEIRPVGSYTVSPPNPEQPHREGGGPEQDAVVLFSIRGCDGVLYEVLNDDGQCIGTLTMQDFVGLYHAQQALEAPSR